MSNSHEKIHGFTLIEILLVLAIISILGTIVFTAVASQRKRAKVIAAVSAVKSAMTMAMACDSTDGKVVPPEEGSIGGGMLCAKSDAVSGVIIWPALTNDCYYCGISGEKVTFRCFGLCGSGKESACSYKTTRCEGGE